MKTIRVCVPPGNQSNKAFFFIFWVLLAFLSLGFFMAGPVLAKTLNTVLPSDPSDLDAAHLFYTQDQDMAENVYQGVVEFDYFTKPPFPVVPCLAETYKVSDDAKMITFYLRKGVQFHHGFGEMTSEDVVFTWRRHMDPKVASRVKSQIEVIDRMEAPDKYTVRIYLKIPSAYSLINDLAYHAGYVMSKKAVETLGDKLATKPVGTGPYYWDRWVPGEKVILKKFDEYWGPLGKVDDIVLWIISDEQVALGALESGKLDFVPVTQQGSPERAQSIKGIEILKSEGNITQFIEYINHKKKPMDDLRIRRALAHALDMKGICDRLGTLVRPYPTPLSPIIFGSTDEFWKYDFSLDKAKKLLAEAGYPNGFDLQMIYNRRGLYEPMVLELKRCWDKIVNVKLELIERAVFVKTMKEFNQHISSWVRGRYGPFQFAECYITGSPENFSQYSSPKLDDAIQRARTARTQDEARRYWREFQRLATEDVVNLWPANMVSIAAMRKGLKGIFPKPGDGIPELKNVYFE